MTNILWLGGGVAGDDTHGHVDDICRFVNPTTVVLIKETNRKDINYRPLAENWERIRDFRLEDGSRPEVVALPMPAPLFCDGDRLPASYANFYIANAAVIVPTFNDPNDRVALGILGELFTGPPGGRHPRRRSGAGLRHAALPHAAAAGLTCQASSSWARIRRARTWTPFGQSTVQDWQSAQRIRRASAGSSRKLCRASGKSR